MWGRFDSCRSVNIGMSRKHQYVDQNQDPELARRIRKVMTRVIHQQLDELEELSNSPPH